MQTIIKKVKTNSKVIVDIGSLGANPSPKVKMILRTYENGVYMSPSLLSVFYRSPNSPASSLSFFTWIILYEIHET